jgi:hypothetical protein
VGFNVGHIKHGKKNMNPDVPIHSCYLSQGEHGLGKDPGLWGRKEQWSLESLVLGVDVEGVGVKWGGMMGKGGL